MSTPPSADGPRPEDALRIVLRPLASPIPLGFLGLFVASLLVSALELRWVPVTQGHHLAIGVLAITVPAQLIGLLFGFPTRDAVAVTGMAMLSGTWAATGVTLLTSPPGTTSPGLGIVLAVGAGALLVPTATALVSKVGVALVLFAAAARFALTAGYELTSSGAWRYSSGVLGVVVAGLALYAALATELESTTRHPVLPLLRPARGRRAASGSLVDQLRGVENEAGVRELL